MGNRPLSEWSEDEKEAGRMLNRFWPPGYHSIREVREEMMAWARRIRADTQVRRRGSMVAVSFTADELVMLRDRVAAGAEVSEEPGWEELLDKIEAASARVLAEGKKEGAK